MGSFVGKSCQVVVLAHSCKWCAKLRRVKLDAACLGKDPFYVEKSTIWGFVMLRRLLGILWTSALLAQAPFVKNQPLAGYRGVDPEQFFAALIAREAAAAPEPTRDKFEDPKAFEARKAASPTGPLPGEIQRDSLIAFKLPLETNYDFKKSVSASLSRSSGRSTCDRFR